MEQAHLKSMEYTVCYFISLTQCNCIQSLLYSAYADGNINIVLQNTRCLVRITIYSSMGTL